MARKSPNSPVPMPAGAPPGEPGLPFDPVSLGAPAIAAWFDAWARMVGVAQDAETARVEVLRRMSDSLRELAGRAAQVHEPADLAALGNRLQQVMMELGSLRQEGVMRFWGEMQQELTRQASSLADRSAMALTAGQVDGREPESPLSTLMAQARVSLEQWTRDWTAVAHAGEGVQ